MTRPACEVSIVIPAYNEAERLGATLEAVDRFFRVQARSCEVVVVDDGSRDRTAELALAHPFRSGRLRVLRNRRNRGKGASVRRGVAAANGAVVLFSDADLSTPIEELLRLEQALAGGADVAVASRAVAGSRIEEHQPFYREWMGKSFNRLVQLLVLPGVHDTQCGFKLFRRDAARALFPRLTVPGFGFDVEVLYLARRQGLEIREVPVAWRNSRHSKVSPLRDAWRMLGDLFRILWRHRKR
ncbi:MAG: dolichyl-phosphate beta-glucosyltransferase [candidate division FCPU426 bacterium]